MQTALGHENLRVGCDRSPVQCPALELPGILAKHHIIGLHRGGDLFTLSISVFVDGQRIVHIPGKVRALGAADVAVGHAVGDGFISDIYIGPAIDLGICTNCMVLPCIPIPVIPFRMGVTRLIQRNVVRFQISLQRAAMESLAHEDILRASLVVVINRLYSYLLIVIDHGDDVGPAIDGDAFQAVRGVSGVLLVVVPGAIVIPAVKFILAGGIGCVVVADIQLAQVDDSALGLLVKCHDLVGRLKVAIAVDHHFDHLLGLALDTNGQNAALVVLSVDKHPVQTVPLPKELRGNDLACLGVSGLGGIGIFIDVEVLVDFNGVVIVTVNLALADLLETVCVVKAINQIIVLPGLFMAGLVVDALHQDL